MSKKAVFAIVVITLLVTFGALYAIGIFNIPRSSNTTTTPSAQLSTTNPLSDPQTLIREVRAYMQQQGQVKAVLTAFMLLISVNVVLL